MEKVTLEQGDYVLSREIGDEAQYHAIARKFLDAGCSDNEYPSLDYLKGFPCFGWSGNGLLHGESSFKDSRQLTPEQVLGTVPKWSGEGLPPVGTKVILSGDDEEIEVMCHGVGEKFCGRDRDGCICIFDLYEVEPTKTTEDQAVEDMMQIFLSCGDVDVEGAMRALYRAGYRKAEKIT